LIFIAICYYVVVVIILLVDCRLLQTPHIYHLSSPLKEVHAKKLIDIGNGIFTVEYLQGGVIIYKLHPYIA